MCLVYFFSSFFLSFSAYFIFGLCGCFVSEFEQGGEGLKERGQLLSVKRP